LLSMTFNQCVTVKRFQRNKFKTKTQITFHKSVPVQFGFKKRKRNTTHSRFECEGKQMSCKDNVIHALAITE
jgi:hypothetical protein